MLLRSYSPINNKKKKKCASPRRRAQKLTNRKREGRRKRERKYWVAPKKDMAEVQIRRYEGDDDEDVKEIFTLGMSEHVPSSCIHVLKQPSIQMLLACVFCALLASSKSILLPILAVTLLLAAGRQGISYMFSNYIQVSFSKDLNNIQKTYIKAPNSCFWVAECQGRVVGTVACLPAEHIEGCLELKRMSVKHSHRGRGIAKALCRTVADFAQARGFTDVVSDPGESRLGLCFCEGVVLNRIQRA
ncbi:hypothetical protein KOW79_002632 [Hemibagrus wyckioides]|uniref:N-acetyltransferase domain-containing protein n=1 Tax=Hemibagrus wyckioides TaxID=337641 RepID=A0A9D3P3V2_9TELE|nr:hypothetical protein KOW79_002632 [Hemibagrus wyckioides]